MKLTIKQIAQMCGGELSANSSFDRQVTSVVIDSREVTPEALFVAIIGEVNDGHKFIEQSFAQGAVAAIVNRSSNISLPNLVIVEDTTKALGLLAANYRQQFSIPIVAITGSNGKTTIKEMLKQVCIAEFGTKHVLASKGSFNNHWGMPLTLLQLNADHKVALLEMGMNHHGELHYLSTLAKPTMAVVNNVLMSHVEFFNSVEDIAKAKGEIYDGLNADGIAMVNTQIPYYKSWHRKLAAQGCRVVEFGSENNQYYLSSVEADNVINIATPQGNLSIKMQVLGQHNYYNAVTVVALAAMLGCSLAAIINGLSSYTGYTHRMEQKRAFNRALIIDDSYNANPDSVRAAVLTVKLLKRPFWFIFADLGELGKFAVSEHENLGAFMADNEVSKLITLGEMSQLTGAKYAKQRGAENWLHFTTKDDIINYCRANLPQQAVLLIKSSNAMKLWEIADKLEK
jgi:UDP-N-acetylmuramoyl-tripeptide--D-alanyl-D-alanine ligase